MRKTNLQIIGMDEREKFQINSEDQIFNKITEENEEKAHPYRYKKYTEHQEDNARQEDPHSIP